MTFVFKFVILYFITFRSEVSAQSHTNFWVQRAKICEMNSTTTFNAGVVTEGDKQYMDFNFISPFPLDENTAMVAVIESLYSNKTALPLFTIRERDFCKAFNKYLGEFWYDIERAAQVTPRVCPIPPGRYHIHHMFLDFKKLTLQTFPFGTLRLTIRGIDKRNKQVFMCLILEVNNRLS